MCKTGPSGGENPYVIEIRTSSYGDVAYEEIHDDDQPIPRHRTHDDIEHHQSVTTGNKDSFTRKIHEGGLTRNSIRPPSGDMFEKLRPLVTSSGDNREEICLEVQSVLQAGNVSEDMEADEDPEAESNVALLDSVSQDKDLMA